MNGTVKDVKDEKTAEDALPKLDDIKGKLDGYQKKWEKMSEGGRAIILKVFGTVVATVKTLVTNLLANEAVAGKLKVILTEIVGKLTGLQKTT